MRDSRSPDAASPKIIDLEVLSMIELVEARDRRMTDRGGRWFGNYETPVVLSKRGKKKLQQSLTPDTSTYGRKESEGEDFNEDTNFGKLKRIPHPLLKAFLAKHRLTAASSAEDEDEDEDEDLCKALEEMKEADPE